MKQLSAYHQHRSRRYLSLDDVRRLLEVATGETRVFCEVCYGSGCRVAELVGLTWDCVDLEAGTIRVTGKGRKTRVCPIGRPATMALASWKAQRESESGGICDEKNDGSDITSEGQGHASATTEPSRGTHDDMRGDPHVLGMAGGVPRWQPGVLRHGEAGAEGGRAAVFSLSTQQVRDRLRALDSRLGFHVSPHMLRHAYATAMHENGADVISLMQLLGHCRVDTTARYINGESTVMEQGQMVADCLMAARGKLTTKRLRRTMSGLAWR